MRAFREMPHSVTMETSNFMMLGRETRLPDTLSYNPSSGEESSKNEYVVAMEQRMKVAHQLLGDQQAQVKEENEGEPLRFAVNDLVLLENRRR